MTSKSPSLLCPMHFQSTFGLSQWLPGGSGMIPYLQDNSVSGPCHPAIQQQPGFRTWSWAGDFSPMQSHLRWSQMIQRFTWLHFSKVLGMCLGQHSAYQEVVQAHLEAYHFMTNDMGIHIFPILCKLLGFWASNPANDPSRLFKWIVIPVTVLRMGTSPCLTGEAWVFQALAQGLVKWGQVSISLTLYILLGFPPLSPLDPPPMEYCWRDHLPQMPIPRHQNILTSFPAWCQRQTMRGLQMGFSVFKPL